MKKLYWSKLQYMNMIANVFVCLFFQALHSEDIGWSCPSCTLVNASNSTVCTACGAVRNGALSAGKANPRRTFQRQQSIPVESRRKRDEKQAKEQWINIIKYCKDVRMFSHTCTCTVAFYYYGHLEHSFSGRYIVYKTQLSGHRSLSQVCVLPN